MSERQGKLEGIAGKTIPEIEEAAEELYKLQRKRKDIAEEEENARTLLNELLKKHGYRRRAYVFEATVNGEERKLDALVEQPEERAYVRLHKDPKKKGGEDDEADA